MVRFELVQVGSREHNKAAVIIEKRLFGLLRIKWVKIHSIHPDFDKWHNVSNKSDYGYANMGKQHIEAAYLSLVSGS